MVIAGCLRDAGRCPPAAPFVAVDGVHPSQSLFLPPIGGSSRVALAHRGTFLLSALCSMQDDVVPLALVQRLADELAQSSRSFHLELLPVGWLLCSPNLPWVPHDSSMRSIDVDGAPVPGCPRSAPGWWPR